MFLSLYLDKILINLDKGESFIAIQDATKINFCFEYVKEGYAVPYVAFPILHDVARRLKYQLRMSETMERYYKEKTAQRMKLLKLKQLNTLDVSDNTDITSSIVSTIESSYGYELLPEQRVTVAYCLLGKRVIIANDIGTGKTVTINTVAKVLIKQSLVKKVLILLPASLVGNWIDDYHKFFGWEGLLAIESNCPKDRRIAIYNQFNAFDNINFLVVNYDKCNYDYKELQKIKCDMIVVDEFHIMKNFTSATRSINFFDLVVNFWKPRYRFPMSGSPIENQLFDLYPIFKLIDGGHMLGGEKYFQENFIEYETEKAYRWSKRSQKHVQISKTKAVGFKKENRDYLNILIRPLIIRKKLKLKVGKYPQDIFFDPSPKTLEKYEELKRMYLWKPSAAYHAVRQFLCSPERYGFDESPKLEHLQEFINQTDEKVVIFSFYKCSIRTIKEFLQKQGLDCFCITGEESEDPLVTIKKFKASKHRFLLATDKVNYGHNIQFCRFMIQWDKSFKPTTEDQRIGRLYRTGQQSDVHIYTYITRNTVEERIYDQFMRKKELIEKIITPLGERDEEKIKQLEQSITNEIMKEFK